MHHEKTRSVNLPIGILSKFSSMDFSRTHYERIWLSLNRNILKFIHVVVEGSFCVFFPFCWCDKILAKSNLGRKELILSHHLTLPSDSPSSREAKAGIQRPELRQKGWWNTAYWLACFQAHVLTQLRTDCPETVWPTVSGALPHQTYPQANLIETILQSSSLSSVVPSLCQLDKNSNLEHELISTQLSCMPATPKSFRHHKRQTQSSRSSRCFKCVLL